MLILPGNDNSNTITIIQFQYYNSIEIVHLQFGDTKILDFVKKIQGGPEDHVLVSIFCTLTLNMLLLETLNQIFTVNPAKRIPVKTGDHVHVT